MKRHLLSIVERFAGTRVLVLADLVLDEFLYGEIARVSREAPVLILEHRDLDAMPGGGANAANNVKALGGVPLPVGAVGHDDAGTRLLLLLEEAGIETSGVARVEGYVTPTKTRVLAGLPHCRPQQVIRIDRGARTSSQGQSGAAQAAAQRALAMLSGGAKGLLVSDYGYDLVTPQSAQPVLEQAASLGVPVACDSRHRLRGYRGVTAVTPNLEEAEEMLGMRLDEGGTRLDEAARRLMESLDCRAVLITRGSHGMTLLEDGVRPLEIPVYGSDQVADVTGAGDTVIATFTLALAAGATFRAAAILANTAAGLSVMKRSTSTVTAAELKGAILGMPEEPA